MKKSGFLNNLKKEGKLNLVEPSEEICNSYLEKADNCLKSAKILLKNDLYENSISMSYYVMYNSLTALLFKIGIKCENHSGSILIFKKLFDRDNMFRAISFAKEERIDKQYYVVSKQNFILTKASAQDMTTKAENFIVQMKLIVRNLKNGELKLLREKFEKILIT